MLFKSKIDTWLILVMALATGAPVALSLMSEPKWPGVIITLPIMLFFAYSVFTIRYTITADGLLIQSGVYNFKPIPVSDIRRIEETRSILSSPAASLDRLEIVYNRFDSVIISPKDKAGLIDALLSINPAIEVKLRQRA
jgi:hypothetical protein